MTEALKKYGPHVRLYNNNYPQQRPRLGYLYRNLQVLLNAKALPRDIKEAATIWRTDIEQMYFHNYSPYTRKPSDPRECDVYNRAFDDWLAERNLQGFQSDDKNAGCSLWYLLTLDLAAVKEPRVVPILTLLMGIAIKHLLKTKGRKRTDQPSSALYDITKACLRVDNVTSITVNPKQTSKRTFKILVMGMLLSSALDFDKPISISFDAIGKTQRQLRKFIAKSMSKQSDTAFFNDRGFQKLAHAMFPYYSLPPKWITAFCKRHKLRPDECFAEVAKDFEPLRPFYRARSAAQAQFLNIDHGFLSLNEFIAVCGLIDRLPEHSQEDKLTKFCFLCTTRLGLPLNNTQQIRFVQDKMTSTATRTTLWIDIKTRQFKYQYCVSPRNKAFLFANQEQVSLPLPKSLIPFVNESFVQVWQRFSHLMTYRSLQNKIKHMRDKNLYGRFTSKNLNRSFFNAVLQTNDLVAACYTGFQRYEPPTLLQYTTVTRSQLIESYRNTLQAMSDDIDFNLAEQMYIQEAVYGSKRSIPLGYFGQLFEKLKRTANQHKDRYANSHSPKDLCNLFNAYSELYVFLIIVSTNMRPVVGLSAINANYFTDQGVALISDKADGKRSVSVRGLNTMASAAVSEHRRLINYLKSQIEHRFLKRSPLARSLNQLVTHEQKVSLFFRLDDEGKPIQLPRLFLKNLFAKHLGLQVAPNVNRHCFATWCTKTKQHHLISRAGLGHAGKHQDIVSIYSNISLAMIGNSLSAPLDSYMQDMGIPINPLALKCPHTRPKCIKYQKLTGQGLFHEQLPIAADLTRLSKRDTRSKDVNETVEQIIDDLNLSDDSVIYQSTLDKAHERVDMIKDERLATTVKISLYKRLDTLARRNSLEPGVDLYSMLNSQDGYNQLLNLDTGRQLIKAKSDYKNFLSLLKQHRQPMSHVQRLCCFTIHAAYHLGYYSNDPDDLLEGIRSWDGSKTLCVGKKWKNLKRWFLDYRACELLNNCHPTAKLISGVDLKKILNQDFATTYQSLGRSSRALALVHNGGFEVARRYLKKGTDFIDEQAPYDANNETNLSSDFDYINPEYSTVFGNLSELKRLLEFDSMTLTRLSTELFRIVNESNLNRPAHKLYTWIIALCKNQYHHKIRSISGLVSYVRRALEFFIAVFKKDYDCSYALSQDLNACLNEDPEIDLTHRTAKSLNKHLTVYYQLKVSQFHSKPIRTESYINAYFAEKRPIIAEEVELENPGFFRVVQILGIRQRETRNISISNLGGVWTASIQSYKDEKGLKTTLSNRAFYIQGGKISVNDIEDALHYLDQLDPVIKEAKKTLKQKAGRDEAAHDRLRRIMDLFAYLDVLRHRSITEHYLTQTFDHITDLTKLWEIARRVGHVRPNQMLRTYVNASRHFNSEVTALPLAHLARITNQDPNLIKKRAQRYDYWASDNPIDKFIKELSKPNDYNTHDLSDRSECIEL